MVIEHVFQTTEGVLVGNTYVNILTVSLVTIVMHFAVCTSVQSGTFH